MAADEKWYFTKEQLTNTPSRKCGIDADKELSYRQQAANFIQDMGQKLNVTQLCINTAIVYMHRFYVFHSLSQFHRNAIASAALFLAAKVEEQPRKLEHVIKVSHLCLHREPHSVDIKSEQYLDQAQDLVFNENVLLQTLGFDVAIDHPHTHVVRCCQLVKASKDLAQTSYFMASNSLHLTTMCLQYKPTVVACFCIHLACKWSNWEIPQSNEGKYWFWYVDPTVTAKLLQQLTAEFLHIFDKCPSRLKKKIMSISEKQSPSMHHPSLPNSLFDAEPRRINSPANDGGPTFQSLRPFPIEEDKRRPSTSIQSRPPVDYREHREKKERERLERDRMTGASGITTSSTSTSLSSSSVVATAAQSQAPSQDLKSHSHHHQPITTSTSISSSSSSSISANATSSGALVSPVINKHQSMPNQKTNIHHNHHHRPDLKIQQPSQRHSSNSQSRDPSRDISRQRIPRDYTANQGSTSGPPFPHAHSTVHQINSVNEGASTSDITAPNIADSIQLHQNPVDKLINNNHNVHRPIQHDKRAFDPRHKMMEHRKEDQKNYVKYAGTDQVRADRQRKLDSLEQRSEEVRKLIEKPLPLPKPRAEVQKEEYIASMLKQSHHPKYGQEKIPPAHNSSRSSLVPHDFSKASTSKPLMATTTQHLHGVTSILKDIKNGNSNVVAPLSSNNNVDDPKAEKRPRPEEPILTQVQPVKHKSLFSPEKIPNSRELHSQRTSKSTRQKTPPVSVKTVKQERIPELPQQTQLQSSDMISPFASPPPHPQSLLITNQSTSSHKRTKAISVADTDQSVKVKLDDQSGFEAMKMLGRVPELIQPIRDTPGSTNGRTSSVANDLKPPELIKPFEPEVDTRHAFTNGLDGINVKNDSRDSIQRKDESNINTVDRLENPLQRKNEYFNPLKSAQTISALLQEPLAPMPSLLQPTMSDLSQNTPSLDSGIFSSGQTSSQEQHINQAPTPVNISQVHETAPITDEQFTLSTVDISALSTPVQIVPEVPIIVVTNNPPADIRKTEHHKSEKKKKKEKHKHKDKDKSKEKHKHKHKDKDKEKHRDKDRDKEKDKERSKDKDKDKDKDRDNKIEENSAAPIKITIPKDKLNLSSDSNIIQEKISPQNTGLKIKIPKERLKGADSSIVPIVRDVQAPLKIKIRTSSAISEYPESRKRDRDFSDSLAPPPSKKSQLTSGNQMFVGQQPLPPPPQQQHQQQHQQHLLQQQSLPHQRSSERQNGRHYSSGSNNKVRGGAGGGGRGIPTRKFNTRIPPANLFNSNLRDNSYYPQNIVDQEIYARNSRLSNAHPRSINNDVGFTHAAAVATAAQDSQFFYTNYPPPNIFNPTGYFCDPSMYYQQYQQQFMYPPQSSVLLTVDGGAIDTSVPPPNIPTSSNLSKNGKQAFNTGLDKSSSCQSLPPLPSEPPPHSSPPPPPPPE